MLLVNLSVEGLYAAGDILSYEGKVHLITGAFHDAVNAVNKAKQYIQPEANKSGWFLHIMNSCKKLF